MVTKMIEYPLQKDKASQVERAYRYSMSLTSQFFFCGIPFRLDSAPKCPLNCSYCFAMSRGGRRTSTTLLVDTSKIQRKIDRITRDTPIVGDVTGELLEKRMPLHFGGMSDPFASKKIAEKSIELLRILNQVNYPVILSTKNPRVL